MPAMLTAASRQAEQNRTASRQCMRVRFCIDAAAPSHPPNCHLHFAEVAVLGPRGRQGASQLVVIEVPAHIGVCHCVLCVVCK